MKKLFYLLFALSLPIMTHCSKNQNLSSYRGTASVGDFVLIDVDSSTKKISYHNLSNGLEGVASYTIDSDGAYLISDPNQSLLKGYEIPGYALIIAADKTGPGKNMSSLITAITQTKIEKDDLKDRTFNMMQFRTNSGGLEVGWFRVDTGGYILHQGYWPYGKFSNQSTFTSNVSNGGAPTSLSEFSIAEDSTYLKATKDGSSDYVFATKSGMLAIDTPNGAILALEQKRSDLFDPADAGTYKAMVYKKRSASTGQGNIEVGDSSVESATIEVSTEGKVTMTDNKTQQQMVSTKLVPLGDNDELFGQGRLSSRCSGIFTFSYNDNGHPTEVFVVFLDKAMLFSSFSSNPGVQNKTYNYFYGAGLKK